MANMLCIAEMFEAIAGKDEPSLVRVLERSTIETMLLFESTYGISPLVHCVRAGDMSHLGMVRRLLASGLCDCEAVDSKGRTVLASLAAAPTDRTAGFLERIVEIVIEGADDVTACYRMLKHNSRQLLEVFLSIKRYDEGRLFESLASALTKLKVKLFVLSKDLELFVHLKLAEYGYRHLSGDAPTESAVEEWKDQIDVVADCWKVIGELYDTGMYGDMDNRLLHRLHVIHNHLYFLQNKKFLNHLPLREAIFCVAVLWNCFTNPPNFTMYRTIVNKRLAMEFIRMVAFQLVKAKNMLVQVENQLAAIVREVESSSMQRMDTLFEELMEKIKISCKPTIARQYEEKWNATGPCNVNRNALVKDMIRQVRKADMQWADAKLREVKELQQSQKGWLIEQLDIRLECVERPDIVADKVLAGLKRNQVDTIAAKIVATGMFDLEHLMRGKDRRTSRKLIKCYDQLKQVYSIKKILKSLEHIARVKPVNKETCQDCLKRIIMVLGETLKNTINTPNMPNGRFEDAMERMLSSGFAAIISFLRDSYAHALSLSRVMIENELEWPVYSVLPNHTMAIRMVFNLLYAIVLADVRRSFYGQLLRCDSLATLRSLLIYAGEEDTLLQLQHESLRFVQSYFEQVKTLFKEIHDKPVGGTVEFAHLQEQLRVQCEIVEQVEAMLATENEINFESVRDTCFSCSDMSTIRRLLHWKIDAYRPNAMLDNISKKWNTNVQSILAILWMDRRLIWLDPNPIMYKLSMLGGIENAEAFYNIGHTRKLIKELGVEDSVDGDALNHLNAKLWPYYRNIFFLDNKWRELQSFRKQRNLSWSGSLVRELRQRDQELLQQLFDVKRNKLNSILALHGIQKGVVMRDGDIIIDEDILASIEYLQLEICEILTAVGYFGDSFQYIKQRIPMIQGKNYRNLLAHDSLSYNMLTDSGDAVKIINAIIFANTEVQLFERNERRVPIKLQFPSLADMHRWVEEQQRLLTSLLSDDVKQVHAMIQSGGELNSYFCFSPNPAHFPARCLSISHTIQGFCERTPSIIPLLGRYFPYLYELHHHPVFAVESAIVHRDFEAGFKLIDETRPFAKPNRFCSWPKLMARLSTAVKASKTLAERRDLLSQFLDYGNEECIREMVLQYPDFGVTLVDTATVSKAILRGLRSTTKLLLYNTNRWESKIFEMLAVMHWNDLLIDDSIKVDIKESVIAATLQASIKSRNEKAFLHFLTKTQCTPTILAECYLTAAAFGRCTILKHLLDVYPTTDRAILSTAIHKAALSYHWPCVRLLLTAEAPVDVLIPGYQDEDANVLLILVANEQIKLVRQIIAINREIFGTSTLHPLAVAVRYETASDSMVQALRAHGFDWLDSSTTLHEVILKGFDDPAWSTIWEKIDQQLSRYRVTIGNHYSLHINLLHRWKMISFVEECNMKRTSLCCAAETEDPRVVRELINRSCSMRKLDGVGVLGDIVFRKDSSFVHYYKNPSNAAWTMESCCADMISRLENLAPTNGEMNWQEIDLVVTGVSIVVAVLEDTFVPQIADLELRDSTSLQENFQDILTITDSFNRSQIVVCGMFSLGNRTIHFMRIEDTACVYDVFPPDGRVDLSNTLNIKDEEHTALRKIIERQLDLETVKLLVQSGANPLLGDQYGTMPISIAIPKLPEAALYLMDECLGRDIRNADGIPMVKVINFHDGDSLIHTAASCCNQQVIARLLEYNIDLTVQNVYGCTPAHTAAHIPKVNTISTMKQLLDYDRTPVNMTDCIGNTLLMLAAKNDSIKMLDLIMKYKPNLTLPANRRSLYEAVACRHVEWAKRFLQHAIEAGVREVTKMEDPKDDIVLMSLRCEDFELSKALLEYELGHPLEEITVLDRPRIEALQKSSTSNATPCILVANTHQMPGELNLELVGLVKPNNFLTFLGNLLTKLGENQH